jgi:hypothetical protein
MRVYVCVCVRVDVYLCVCVSRAYVWFMQCAKDDIGPSKTLRFCSPQAPPYTSATLFPDSAAAVLKIFCASHRPSPSIYANSAGFAARYLRLSKPMFTLRYTHGESTHTHGHTHTNSHTLKFTDSYAHSHIYTHAHTHTLSHSLFLSHSISCSHTRSHTSSANTTHPWWTKASGSPLPYIASARLVALI